LRVTHPQTRRWDRVTYLLAAGRRAPQNRTRCGFRLSPGWSAGHFWQGCPSAAPGGILVREGGSQAGSRRDVCGCFRGGILRNLTTVSAMLRTAGESTATRS